MILDKYFLNQNIHRSSNQSGSKPSSRRTKLELGTRSAQLSRGAYTKKKKKEAIWLVNSLTCHSVRGLCDVDCDLTVAQADW